MVDDIYRPDNVDSDLRPIFEQLSSVFGQECEIWRRVEDFGRQKSAGIVNRSSRAAAIVALSTGIHRRAEPLSAAELARIHEHFASGSTEDLRL